MSKLTTFAAAGMLLSIAAQAQTSAPGWSEMRLLMHGDGWQVTQQGRACIMQKLPILIGDGDRQALFSITAADAGPFVTYFDTNISWVEPNVTVQVDGAEPFLLSGRVLALYPNQISVSLTEAALLTLEEQLNAARQDVKFITSVGMTRFSIVGVRRAIAVFLECQYVARGIVPRMPIESPALPPKHARG